MGPFISEGFSEGNFSHFSNARDLGDGDESTGFGSRGSGFYSQQPPPMSISSHPSVPQSFHMENDGNKI